MEPRPSCPSCGKALEPDAPQGLCQACLLEAGFPTGTGTGGATAHFVPPEIAQLAAKFPQLEILEFVGQGGMGAVYKARQKALDRLVALKILPPRAAAAPDFAGRFTREARALAKLNHPHIVTLYEFGQTDGLFYFLMEFVDGLNLRQVLKASRLAPKEALAIVPQICDALQYAHERGIVHRDIKPENILLSREGSVKIADFGVAKLVEPGAHEHWSAGKMVVPSGELTQAGSTLGTPKYMAPEQLKNSAEVDHRADIYSLGVVFYQMLTGELPSAQVELPSRKVAIDVRLDAVVLRALEREPERRYQHISDIRESVETIARSPSRDEEPGRQTSRPAGSLVQVAWIIGFLAVLTIVGIYLIPPRVPKMIADKPDEPARQTEKQVRGNPAHAQSSDLPGVDPGTGLPVPASGASASALASEADALYRATAEVQDLIFSHKYEEALQRCLAFHERSRNSASFLTLLNQWIELGRRYPKAKQALSEIRDRDVREFTEGRGYFDLFMEISHINRGLQDEEATVALFKAIQSDKQLAQACFPVVSTLLIERSEYELCLSYLPEPEMALEQYRQSRERFSHIESQGVELRKRQAEQFQAMQKTNSRLATLPIPAPVGPPLLADKSFVDMTCQLIEVLVGSGHKAEAEKIRDEALGTMDSARLKSSVADAEQRIQKRRSPGSQ